MKICKNVMKSVTEVEKMVCNCCGKEIKKNASGYFDEYINIEKTWGYGSPFDGQTHQFDICGSCYEKWISQFAVKPNNE